MIAVDAEEERSVRIERVGLVGLGYIASFHAAAVRQLGSQVQVIGLDLDREAARRAERNGLVDKVVGDLDELMDAAPDVVHVLTPPATHGDTASWLLQRGVDVLVEKPLAHSRQAAAAIADAARAGRATVGVSHNLLFSPVWERTRTLLAEGGIGLLRSVDVTTRRPLPALRSEDTRVWMLQGVDHVLFEIAPHAFAQVLDLVPEVQVEAVVTGDTQHLPNGVAFVRSWDVIARAGDVGVRLALAFDDAMASSTVQLRGTLGQLDIDLDRSTLTVTTRGAASYDLEIAGQSIAQAGALARDAARRLIDVAGSKAAVGTRAEPFAAGIASSVAAFSRRPQREVVDRRQSLDLALAVVDLADTVAQQAHVERHPAQRPLRPRVESSRPSPSGWPEVLVLGGTGFIGRHVVRRLASSRPVRVLARRPDTATELFADLPVDVVKGDIGDTESVCAQVGPQTTVIDLAFSGGTTWEALERADLAATTRRVDALSRGELRRYIYASTIAIYDAGRVGGVITERTSPGRGTVRVAPYPRMKLAVERHLEHLHQSAQFPVVVARPGVVVGVDSEPCHWGVAAWPYTNVCVHWGRGDHPLPLVLVEDVAAAFVAMVDADGIDGESFNLCAPASITAAEYVAALSHATGTPIRDVPRSTARWYLASLAAWAVKFPGGGRVPVPSWSELAGRGFASRFDCAKAATVLGWEPEDRTSELVRRGVVEPAKAWQR